MKKIIIFLLILAIIVIGVVATLVFFNEPESVVAKETLLPKKINNTSCVADSFTDKIYCFGGRDGNILYNSIIAYDLNKTVLETKSAKLPTATFAHSCVGNLGSNKIYCFGGYNPSFSSAIFEYDTQNDKLTMKNSFLPEGTGGLSCAESLATNKIYCFGGFTGKSVPGPLTEGAYGKGIYRNTFIMSDQVLEYDPDTDTIAIKKSALPGGRDDLSCVPSSNPPKIYCFGGGTADSAFDQIIEYDPVADKLDINEAKLPTKMDILSCAENSNNQIYCFGGETSRADQNHVLYNEISEYDPVADTLLTRPVTLPSAVGGLSCAKDSSTYNSILCFGGWAEKSSDLIFEYNRGNKINEILEQIKNIF